MYMTAEEMILKNINDQEENLVRLATEIWKRPEVALEEEFASALLAGELEAAGFRIEWGVGGMATAFVAHWVKAHQLLAISVSMMRYPVFRRR